MVASVKYRSNSFLFMVVVGYKDDSLVDPAQLQVWVFATINPHIDCLGCAAGSDRLLIDPLLEGDFYVHRGKNPSP